MRASNIEVGQCSLWGASWARRALDVLAENGWIDAATMAQEVELGRIETRPMRGLRLQTIRQRVLTIERLQRWAYCSLGKAWPTTTAELEEDLQDLAADPKRGTSSFARAKKGSGYAEAAADRPQDKRLGDSDAVRVASKS